MSEGRGTGINHAWTDPIVARLRQLHAEGLSCSQAAMALNKEFQTSFSRNSVIGKLNRLGLSWRGASAPTTAQQFNQSKVARIAKARAAANPIYGGNPRTSPQKKALDAIAANVQAASVWVDRPETAGKKTLLQLDTHDCRWGVGDPSSDGFRFCAEPQKVGKPYCERHCRLAFQKPLPPRPKTRADIPRRRVA